MDARAFGRLCPHMTLRVSGGPSVNLFAKLTEREAAGRPIRIGLIGAGKFGTMFLTQVRRTAGMHLVGLADLNAARAKSQLASAGWDAAQYSAGSPGDAL